MLPDMSSPPPAIGFMARMEAAGFDRVGSILVALGGLLVLAADTVLSWFRSGSGFFSGAGSNSTFSDLHDLLDQRAREVSHGIVAGHFSFGVSRDYFGWLGWGLLIGALAVGTLAVSAVGASHFSVRWLGAVVSVTGFALTLAALNLISVVGKPPSSVNIPQSYGEYFSHSGFGAWFALLGFLFILVGCLVSGGGR
jgi:hypothetical protein